MNLVNLTLRLLTVTGVVEESQFCFWSVVEDRKEHESVSYLYGYFSIRRTMRNPTYKHAPYSDFWSLYEPLG